MFRDQADPTELLGETELDGVVMEQPDKQEHHVNTDYIQTPPADEARL